MKNILSISLSVFFSFALSILSFDFANAHNIENKEIVNNTSDFFDMTQISEVSALDTVPITLDNLQFVNLPSVKIGTQIWSSRNLDVATYSNGDPIPKVRRKKKWKKLKTGAWCWYNNDSAAYAATYGRLYNWYAVNDPRGLAPKGWHVPTEAEWNKLIIYLDAKADTLCYTCYSSTIAGGAQKSTTIWKSPNTGATNSSGFSGLPGGARGKDGSFSLVRSWAQWWSASECEFCATKAAWTRCLYNFNSNILRLGDSKRNGVSVRVVRD